VLFAGLGPSARLVGHLLIAPLLSVSLVAWLSGNPFNGTVLAVLAATLVGTTARFSNASVRLASRAWVAAGGGFTVFGWTYPHFLRTDSWTTSLYTAPFGLLPCPTLSVVIDWYGDDTERDRHPVQRHVPDGAGQSNVRPH
jgi:hypothetical protein